MKREKWRVVKYKVPSNSAIQLFDFKTNEKQVVFGPSLILLQPHQEFTLIKLSGGTPKQENRIKTLYMQLGPDFMTDIVIVETSDHAQLRLELCYNWKFQVEKSEDGEYEEEAANKLFCIEDFVGNCCKNIASRIRGNISGVAFDEFQRDSDNIMKRAVFGIDKHTNQPKKVVHFKANNLFITSVDVKQITPVDKEVQRNLDQARVVSMNMTTQSAKSDALHKAAQLDQKNKGKLKCQELKDKKDAEQQNQELLQAKANTLKIQLAGNAKAKAQAEARRQEILGKSKVEQARLKAEENEIKQKQELKTMKQDQEAQIKALQMKNTLEINKAEKMAQIEIAKFEQIIGAVGKETLVAISRSGPAMKAKMLKGLGLKGFLVTDGKNPINLFNTANGMLG